MELKLQIKTWEREFFNKHGKKPSASDIKADSEIHSLYKLYQKSKAKDPAPSTPKKSKQRPVPIHQGAETQPDEDQEVDFPAEEINEVFPTPQMGGRLLGLFEIRVPETPSKRVETPQKQRIVATPTSRRTPTYLRQRQEESSPFPKRSRRYKSISELAANNAHLNSDDEAPTVSLAEIAQFSLVTDETKDKDQATPQVTATANNSHKKSRTIKQRNRKVIRPVLETDVPVTSQAQTNYKRLNIQRRKIPTR